MTPVERDHLRALAERVRRIRAYSNERPHVFLEDKSEIARDMDRLAGPADAAPAKPKRDAGAAFGSALRRTVTAARGHEVVVERRSRA